jgi:hypothetical protein
MTVVIPILKISATVPSFFADCRGDPMAVVAPRLLLHNFLEMVLICQNCRFQPGFFFG